MLIEAVYLRWNREKLADVADLMRKYEGQEAEIYDKIVRKYVFCQEEQYWRPLISGMYRRFSPAKLPNLEPILAKYRSSEAALYRALCDKYIPTVAPSELRHQAEVLEGAGVGAAEDDDGYASGDGALMAEPVGCGERLEPWDEVTPPPARMPADDAPDDAGDEWEEQQAARALGGRREVLATAAPPTAREQTREELPQGLHSTSPCAAGECTRSASGERLQGGQQVPERSPSHSSCSRRRSPLRGPSPPRRYGQRDVPGRTSPPRPPSPPQRRSPPRRLSRRRRSAPGHASPRRLTPPRRRQPSPRRRSPSRRRHLVRRSPPRRGGPICEHDLASDGVGSDDRRAAKRPHFETFVSQVKSRRKQREAQATREESTRVEAARKAEVLLDGMPLPVHDERDSASPERIGDQEVEEDEAAIRKEVDAVFGDVLPDPADAVSSHETIAADEYAEHLVTTDDPVAVDKLARAAERKARRREMGEGTVKRKKRKPKLETLRDGEASTDMVPAAASQDAVASPFDVLGAAPQASPTDEMVSEAIAAAAAHAGQVRVRRRRKKVVLGEEGEMPEETAPRPKKKRKKDKARLGLGDAPAALEEQDPRNREASIHEAADEQAPASPATASRREETREMLLLKMQKLKRSTRAAEVPHKAPATRPKAGFPPVPRAPCGREVPVASCQPPSDEEDSATDPPSPPAAAAPPARSRAPGTCVFTEPPPGVWHTTVAPATRAAPRAPGGGPSAIGELDRRPLVQLRGAREAELRNKALDLLDRLRPVSKAFG